MNLRPATKELLHHCAATEFCDTCKYRVGCGIRYCFYDEAIRDELQFELFIQGMEVESQPIFGENLAFEGTEHIRRKVTRERKIHPLFSYT